MRLDFYLCRQGFFKSRTKAAEACRRGEVMADGKVVFKPSFEVCGQSIEVRQAVSYVSLGGYKLEKALDDFGFCPSGKVFADIGASTGGFTDCLLKRGAAKVYAVDVGEKLLDKSLLGDKRLVVMDNTNARNLTKENFPEKINCVTIDCSFISLQILLPALAGITDESGCIIALIKPQFECGKGTLGKSGILFKESDQLDVVLSLYKFCINSGLKVKNITYSPINPKKNIEYFILLEKTGENITSEFIKAVVAAANKQLKKYKAENK